MSFSDATHVGGWPAIHRVNDIVCLQEVMYRRSARLLRRAAPVYRHHAYAGTVVLKGGPVLLSRWPITPCRFVRYPMTAPVRPELIMRKGAQMASVATRDGELVVVNTHLSANREDRRRSQAGDLDAEGAVAYRVGTIETRLKGGAHE